MGSPQFAPKAPKPSPKEIKEAREAAGLTQTEAGQLLYSGVRTWQKWELGERGMPPGLWELFLIKTNQLDHIKNMTKQKSSATNA